MTPLSRAVYALILVSSPLPAVLARPLSLATNSQAEELTTYTGKGTWFYPGLGACGDVDSALDPIVAIASSRFGTGGNCDQWIKITNTDNGMSTYGKTRDSCPSCGSDDLDMSPAVFEEIGNTDAGLIPVSWNFQPMGWSP